MLNIENLVPATGVTLHENDVIESGKAELALTGSLSMFGHFTTSRAGTGEVAEISVAGKVASNTEVTVANVAVTLVGRITRTLKKDATKISLADTFPTADDTKIKVLDPDTGAVLSIYDADDNPTGELTSISAGDITFRGDAAAADKDYIIELPVLAGTASPTTAATVKVEAGSYHVHILSRLRDDVAESRMHNLTSFTFTKYIPTSVDL